MTAKEWVEKLSQSGAFDLVESCEEAVGIIEQIQGEAYQLGWHRDEECEIYKGMTEKGED